VVAITISCCNTAAPINIRAAIVRERDESPSSAISINRPRICGFNRLIPTLIPKSIASIII
jgi:hypothetical protein